MKYSQSITSLKTILWLILSTSSFAQNVIPINIQHEVQNKNAEVINREISYINEEAYKGIRLNEAYEDGIVWLKNFEFENGIVEFDVRGKDLKQHSFVGIAFHGADTTTFESIYLRPFNFKAQEDPWKSRAIQYIAKPTYTWQVLRENFPNKYESSISPAPDPDAWVHVRVIVKDASISTYINNNNTPSLVVDKLGKSKKGSVGFYVADTSGGDFANLKITKTD